MWSSNLQSLKSTGQAYKIEKFIGAHYKLAYHKYVFYTFAYCSARRDDENMIDALFDCALSSKENKGSMNKIGGEMKVGHSVKDRAQ